MVQRHIKQFIYVESNNIRETSQRSLKITNTIKTGRIIIDKDPISKGTHGLWR